MKLSPRCFRLKSLEPNRGTRLLCHVLKYRLSVLTGFCYPVIAQLAKFILNVLLGLKILGGIRKKVI